MTRNFRRGLSKDRNAFTNEAMVLSVDADVASDTLRVSLRWQGDHDIAVSICNASGKFCRFRMRPNTRGGRLLNVDSMQESHTHYLGGRSMNPCVR